MTTLFIPSIQVGDWGNLYTKCFIVFICWLAVVFAALLDLWSGLDRAKALGEKPRSDKFRRTTGKVGDYWRFLAFGLIIDVIGSALPFYNLAYASVLFSVACILIEMKSVWENSVAKKSVAANIPNVIKKIISCTSAKDAANIISEIHSLTDKYEHNNSAINTDNAAINSGE